MKTVLLLVASNLFMTVAWYGHGPFSAFQLKILQEIITLVVFTGFVVVYLKESLRWNHWVAMGLIVGAVTFAFLPQPAP
jgi:uncharacterized protein (DUF486 family)